MGRAGVIVLILTGALAGLSLVAWLGGMVAGVGGGFIHLLLIFALMILPAGVGAGVLLLLLGRRQRGPR